ncbi:MAG TPA: hypothetical protein VIY27_04005 [Myxococcota bacterium]
MTLAETVELEPHDPAGLAALIDRCRALSLVEGDGVKALAIQSDAEQAEADELLADVKRYVRHLEADDQYQAVKAAAKRLTEAAREWRAAHVQVLGPAKVALEAGIAAYRRQVREQAAREARERAEATQAAEAAKAEAEAAALAEARKRARGGNRARISAELAEAEARAEEARGASPDAEAAQAAVEASQRFKGGGAVVRTPKAACVNLASLVAAVVASNPELLAEAKRLARGPRTTPPAVPLEVLSASRATLTSLARTYRDRLDVPGVELEWSEYVRSAS